MANLSRLMERLTESPSLSAEAIVPASVATDMPSIYVSIMTSTAPMNGRGGKPRLDRT